jgi:nucleotide-binding universal stress UspA family protein
MTHRFPEPIEADTFGHFEECPSRRLPRLDVADRFTEDPRFERVLVPVDLSTGTLSVLNHACTLACRGSIVRVLHAVHLNIIGEERGIARTKLIRELHEAARKELGRLINSLWVSETPAMVIIRDGHPKDVILQEARASQADLIVMGARERVGWRRLLSCRTAENVIRHAPCPVLVVRT